MKVVPGMAYIKVCKV